MLQKMEPQYNPADKTKQNENGSNPVDLTLN